jgi:hypothetical protein
MQGRRFELKLCFARTVIVLYAVLRDQFTPGVANGTFAKRRSQYVPCGNSAD